MRNPGLRAICLLSWAFLPQGVLAVQDPFGTPIASIEIRGGPDRLLDVIPLKTNDRLTREGVHASIQALYEAGSYAKIDVDAAPQPNGTTALAFIVERPYFLATVGLNPANVLERPLSGYLNLPYGERFSQSQVDRILVAVREQLRREGYFAARVQPTFAFNNETRLVRLTVQVDPGRAARIGTVRFEGGQQTFSEAELRDALRVNGGSRFSSQRLEAGVENVRNEYAELGFLNTLVRFVESYDAVRNTVDVVVSVQPGPFTLVQVRGFDLNDATIRSLVPVFEEGSVDPDLIEEGRVGVLEHLRQQGYFQAGVQAQLIAAPRDNAFQINYLVTPGERFSVREVRIEGNSFFETAALRTVINISRNGLLRQGVFSPELLDRAANTLERVYVAAGFTGTAVEPAFSIEANRITAVLRISEGRRLRIGSVDFVGNQVLEEPDLLRLANLPQGRDYAPAAVDVVRRAIASSYHSRGYPDVRVTSNVRQSDEEGTVGITLTIREGPRYRIGRIYVEGNTRTRTTVVRRRSQLIEGSAYDTEAILQAQQRLYATGLFTRVDIVSLETNDGAARDLLIQLEDAGPLLLTYGAGVQDREGPRGTVELTHSNLWGLDRSLSFRIRGSRREQRFQTTYREPRLFNWALDGFASLFLERTTRQLFDANRIDFSLQTLKQFRNQDSLLLSASFQTVNLLDIRVNPRAGEFPEETGTFHISSISGSYIHDGRNDPINPNRGNYFSGSLGLSDRRWGSDVNFMALFAQAAIYRPAKSTVLAASARFGWNRPYGRTDSLPITERYFAGGATTLRAFGQDEAGPQGGGNALTVLNAEYRFPIPLPLGIDDFGGALFYDTGTTFRRLSDFSIGDFTHTLGFGFRYATPLGPIRVDFGFNVNRQPDEPENQFVLTLGHTF